MYYSVFVMFEIFHSKFCKRQACLCVFKKLLFLTTNGVTLCVAHRLLLFSTELIFVGSILLDLLTSGGFFFIYQDW